MRQPSDVRSHVIDHAVLQAKQYLAAIDFRLCISTNFPDSTLMDA